MSGRSGRGGARPPGRGLKRRVRTAGRRKPSSTRWLQRQLDDPYVAGARAEGYRSRAAYKLIQLDRRFALLGKGRRVVDLGAAPGGWSQVAAAASGDVPVVAVDLLEMDPIEGVAFVRGDAAETATRQAIRRALGGKADVVLSDMASPATGHRGADHLRAVALAGEAYAVAASLLAPGGAFVAKTLRGGADADLLTALKAAFARVVHAKPDASRRDSREIYVVAAGFRGADSSG